MARIDCCAAPYNCAPGATGATNRTGLQAAVTAAAAYDELYFSTGGTYNFDKPAGSIGVDFSGKSNITLTLNGVRLNMSGDAGGTGATWRGIMLANCSGIRINGGTLSQSGVTNFGEQVHMVQVGDATAAVNDVVFNNVRFQQGSGGDGIRILGDGASNIVYGCLITGCQFLECDRSGISIQRGVLNLTINGCYFRNTGDQAIDSEPTSDGPMGYWSVVGNNIDHSGSTGPSVAVTIGGYGDASKSTQVVFVGNVIDDGVLYSGNLQNATIANNSIRAGARCTTGEGLIHLYRRITGTTIQGNTLWRQAAAASGAVIKITQNNGEDPYDFTVIGNTCHQEKEDKIIELDGCYQYQVQNNMLISDVATADVVEGIYSFSSTRIAQDYIISGNRMTNRNARANALVHCRPKITATAYNHGHGIIDNNYGINCNYGIYGSQSAVNHTLPTVSKNYVTSGTLYAVAFSSLANDGAGGGGGLPVGVSMTQPVTIDGTLGSVAIQGPVRIVTGSGSPVSRSEPSGTLYLRQDDAEIWMQTNGAWKLVAW